MAAAAAPHWAAPAAATQPTPGGTFAPVPPTTAALLGEYEPVVAPPPPQAVPGARPPLLVDVTPLSLCVETVSGFCERIIDRNTPVPCERTRDFATAVDNQMSVTVRISQGESSRFGNNTLLGELELSGLRPAPRGAVQIAVSFSLDTDGILNVSARDVATGRATSARVRLVGLPEPSQVEQMMARHMAQPMF